MPNRVQPDDLDAPDTIQVCECRDCASYYMNTGVTSLELEVGDPGDPPPQPVPSELDECECESCKLLRKGGSKLRRTRIESYNSTPYGGWKTKKVTNEHQKLFLGVELETDTPSTYGSNYLVASLEYAASMARPSRHWLAKSDGSVNGPEFSSHPASLKWWRRHRGKVEEMFKMLVHAGYRSHNGGRAGMHVNISRDSFMSPSHLFQFCELVSRKRDWSLAMSQRTLDQTLDFANIGPVPYRSCVLAFERNAGSVTEKYTAVNIPRAEQGRVEFRLPRGTLRPDRFYKNLEWTVAMVEYTALPSVRLEGALPVSFMNWVDDNKAKYPDLSKYIIEKQSELDVAAA